MEDDSKGADMKVNWEMVWMFLSLFVFWMAVCWFGIALLEL
jgi:hypothetical protein